MLGELNDTEIEELLRSSQIGRIGCHAEGRIYVVPVACAYDGQCVLAHSADGLKVRTMRSNPSVCFEVEDIRGIADWRSVIAWGTYEELWGHREDEAVRWFLTRFPELRPGTSAHPRLNHAERSIFFRLRLGQKTGRFERV